MSDYERPSMKPVGNAREQLERGFCAQRPIRRTHKCGACGTPVLSARWRDTGLLVHLERVEGGRGDVEIALELFPLATSTPHAVRVAKGGALRDHGACSHVGRGPLGKVRP